MNIDWNKLTNDVFKIIVVVAVISGITLFIYVGSNISPGTVGHMAQYRMNQSKKNVRQLFLQFLSNYPEYKMPSQYSGHLEPYYFDPNDSVNRTNPMNVDSVNFFFYDNNNDVTMWVAYVGVADHWIRDSCMISLRGIVDSNSIWHYGKNMSKVEKNMYASIFEKKILQRLPSVTYKRFEY